MNTQKAIITDISRFSLNDGPGIRTTIFLKGCPLNCIWCHNPENIISTPTISENDNKCIGCGKCSAVCPNGATEYDGALFVINRDFCTSCGICTESCPSNARQIVGKEYSIDQLIDIVKRDFVYYKNSEGGLTLSGGEPMIYHKFCSNLLHKAKNEDINTAIETCGYTKTEYFDSVLPYCDLFLFDYKETNNIKHKEYTGKKNNLILYNLDYICQNDAKIILRCPIIPGLNDRIDHFEKISEISKKYNTIIGVEIMPYHRYGISKLKKFGIRNNFSAKEPSKEEVDCWLQTFSKLGCKARIG